MDKVYHFVGGPQNGRTVDRYEARDLFTACGTGLTKDMSAVRAAGTITHRKELDNEFTFDGYIGPMYDGVRWLRGRRVYVLRYETFEVYDMLSR